MAKKSEKLDPAHYWSVAEGDIDIQNPISRERLLLLDSYVRPGAGSRVLDVGCGKAFLLRHWAARYGIAGTGLESNPAFVKAAKQLAAADNVAARLEFVEGKAADYKVSSSFDVGVCLGATFALNGFAETVHWLNAAVRPGGHVVVGDLVLLDPPKFGKLSDFPLELADAAGVFERNDMHVLGIISGTSGDFEHYVGSHRVAIDAWLRDNADHPQAPAVRAETGRSWRDYLERVRPRLGWSIFVARKD